MIADRTPPSEPVEPKPTRRQHITREEEADRCLNHTEFSGGAQKFIVAFFLLIVFGIPLLQHVYELRKNPGKAPQVYDVFKLLPSTNQIKEAKGFWGYWSLIPSAESINSFETSLKENSVLTKKLLSPAQAFMTGVLGAGNEKAYVGKNGWLFYRPDVEYLTGGPFLDPDRLKALSRGTVPVQPDPVKAILDFNRQLSERGIRLVVMPVPTKPMIEAKWLIGSTPTLQNPSFAEFSRRLESSGVTVFDPGQAIHVISPPRYLETDTHWQPRSMESAAAGLAKVIGKAIDLSPGHGGYVAKPEDITNLGDIAEMLKLPKDQTIFPKQQVTIDRIYQANGQPWQADHGADVLLLGDSFSNIYSLEGMGWGANAGLAEQLSFDLRRPVDKIVINAGGAYASRRELARQLASGVDRLAGKKVVVLEFSMRDLAQGDWKLIHLARVSATPSGSEPQVAITPGSGDPGLFAGTPSGSGQAPVRPLQSTKPTSPVKKPIGLAVPSVVKSAPPITNRTLTKPANPLPHPLPSEGARGPSHDKPASATKPTAPATQDGLVVTGRIAARAATPKPGSVPYKDCIIALQLTDLQVSGGSVKGPNIVVYVWGMRDNQLVDGAYSVGQTLKFKLAPWASVDSKYGGYNRQELDSDDSLSWAAFWGEISK